MSTITNENNIDELIYAWIKQNASEYTGGDSIVTASSMNDPIQIIILKKRYGGELKEDAMDMLSLMVGGVLHKMIELLKPATIKALIKEYPFVKGLKREKRYEYIINKNKVSGQPDVVYPKIQEIRDYKVTHTAAHTSIDQHQTWNKQLNTLGFLLGLKGIKIKMGVIVLVFRDWSKNQYRLAKIPDKDGNTRNYPMPEEQYEFPMWPEEQQKKMIDDKVYDILDSINKPDDQLPECTQEEMWADPDRWAVKKLEAKKARTLRNDAGQFFSSESEARECCRSGEIVERRPAIRKRCELHHCPVWSVCHQYKMYKEGQV